MVAVPPGRPMELLEFKRQARRTSRVEDPPHELRDLWVWLVTRWQSMTRALSACDLLAVKSFGEQELRRLWMARGDCHDFEKFLEALAPHFVNSQLPRGCLLQACAACAPRITFRHWSNAMLLAYDWLSDLAIAFAQRCGSKQVERVREEDFLEALALQEVCMEDALSWLQAFRLPNHEVDLGLLMKRIIDQRTGAGEEAEFSLDDPDRPSDCMPLEDIAVRLVHSFGDLTLAFNLMPKASQVNQALRITQSVRSLSPRAQAPPGSHRPRKADIGSETRQGLKEKAEAYNPYSLTERHWFHALRGSNEKRLFTDALAKAEAARQMAWQAQRAAVAAALGNSRPAGLDSLRMSLQRLFPNLSDRLCIAKTHFQPFEAMLVRASLAPFGFYGHRFGHVEKPTSARHFVDYVDLCGSRPFIAVLPLGEETALADGGEVEVEYQACLEAAKDGTAVAMLRAPGRAN